MLGNDRANTRFSPLTQINRTTVDRLHIAWHHDQGFGQFSWETFPLVVGGRMYVTTNTNAVWSLDAVTGAVRWVYNPPVDFLIGDSASGSDVPTNRGVAVDHNMVFEITYDCHLLALDATTGRLLWQRKVADPALGYYETMAPTAWDGIVFVGSSGGDSGARGFIAAYNARTGSQIWRRWTVPSPGQGWVPQRGYHGGGAVWMAPTIDPATATLYVTTGNPSPDFDGTARPRAIPYADGILALNARTGTVRWFSSVVAHDMWDYDAASPVVRFDVRLGGHIVPAVGEAGKSGYFVILNAGTGQPLFAPVSFVIQRNQPLPGQSVLRCPGNLGGSEYSPVAYSPRTRAVYISGINLCVIIKRAASAQTDAHQRGYPDLGGDVTLSPHISSGTFTAVRVDTGKVLWQRHMPAPMLGGALATAGGLIFAGDMKGVLYAFDAATGQICWQHALPLSIGSAPIMYSRAGRDYLAIVTGGAAVIALHNLAPVGGILYSFTLATPKHR